ncbi:C40 family peptidase [Bacteroidales bacterium OttesenSCG-928-A17]|nr:C40 family peptidase [Bacteroidales bacterium OttesenSCG-928-A17]
MNHFLPTFTLKYFLTCFMRYFRILSLFLTCCLLFSGCKTASTLSLQKEMEKRASLVVSAEKLKGVPYRYGGNSPRGFDCSGYVNYVFGQVGYKLPRSTEELIKSGKKISEKDAMPGDLIFFRGNDRRNKKAGHVGIITSISGSKIYFIHASTSSGVRVDSNEQEYYKSRYLQIRKILTAKSAE